MAKLGRADDRRRDARPVQQPGQGDLSGRHAAVSSDLATGQGIERDLFALAFASEDQSEGMSAFLEKRTPEFNGR